MHIHYLSLNMPEGDSVINGPIQLSTPLQTLIRKALTLCELMLPHSQAFYPFAAVYENGKAGCLFADDITSSQNESYLIEQLQWRIIDTTTDTHSHSILVYAATVTTEYQKQLDAIAINATDASGNETVLLYPYKRIDGKILISPPMNHSAT